MSGVLHWRNVSAVFGHLSFMIEHKATARSYSVAFCSCKSGLIRKEYESAVP